VEGGGKDGTKKEKKRRPRSVPVQERKVAQKYKANNETLRLRKKEKRKTKKGAGEKRRGSLPLRIDPAAGKKTIQYANRGNLNNYLADLEKKP